MKYVEQYHLAGRTAREIAGSVEDAVARGELKPGGALPTVRGLAADLGVSPATVAAAYQELRRRGIASGVGRAGTRVSAAPSISPRLPIVVPSGVRDLRSGGPDPAFLPVVPVCLKSRRLYGAPPVSAQLAPVATARLGADGIDASHMAVIGGALDGVERTLGAWLRPGDGVAVEDPGYTAALDLLAVLGLAVIPVALDDRGARPDSLSVALEHGARAVLLTPRAQNPTGTAWDERRAAEIHAVLSTHPEVLVIEDDHAGPAASTPFFTACRELNRWATVRSVSKWLGPDLRLAILVGDPRTVSRVEGRQALGTGWVSYLLQDAVADLWSDPATADLLERAAVTYTRRRDALTSALAARGFQASGSSGLTTWVPVGDEQATVAGLTQQGWAVSPGERFRIDSAPGIRIAFATLEEHEAPHFARALSHCVSQRPIRTG